MKKKLLCLFAALVLTMSVSTVFVFADSGTGDGGGISTYDTRAVSFDFKRISDTKASAVVNVQFTSVADSYSVTINLQKRTGSNTWISATDIGGNSHYYSGTNDSSFSASNSWTVKDGGLYRLQVVSRDVHSNAQYVCYTYSDPF